MDALIGLPYKPKFKQGESVKTLDGCVIKIIATSQNYYYVEYVVVSALNRQRENDRAAKFRVSEFERFAVLIPKFNLIWNSIND